MAAVLRFVTLKACVALSGFLIILCATACEDGGWGDLLPDTIIGDLPDAGAGDAGAAPSDAASTDAPGTEDAGGFDAGDTGVVHACGEGPGNEKGVGKPCTKGGGECGDDLSCDIDLDPKGAGVCVLLMCASDKDCGSGAACCTPSGSPIKVCIIAECLPPECGGVVPDGGTATGDGSFDDAQDTGGGGET
jgi:hypothetical protein